MMIAQPEMIRSKIGVKRTKGPQHHQSPRCYSLESASTPAQKGCNSRNYYLDVFFLRVFALIFILVVNYFLSFGGIFCTSFPPTGRFQSAQRISHITSFGSAAPASC